jgi:hypothetical protein
MGAKQSVVQAAGKGNMARVKVTATFLEFRMSVMSSFHIQYTG